MTEVPRCPCCGAPLGATRIIFSLNNNTVVFGENLATLTAQEAEVFAVIYARMPSCVSTPDIISRVYGQRDEPGDAYNVVQSQMVAIRKKLKAIPEVTIETVYRRGYRLVFA